MDHQYGLIWTMVTADRVFDFDSSYSHIPACGAMAPPCGQLLIWLLGQQIQI